MILILIFSLLLLNPKMGLSDESEEQKEKNLESYFIDQILRGNPNSEFPTIKSLLLDMQKSIAALVARENERTSQMEELRAALSEFKRFQKAVNSNLAIPIPPPVTTTTPSVPVNDTVSTTTTVTPPVENVVVKLRPPSSEGQGSLEEKVEILESELQETRNTTREFFQTYCQVTLENLEGSTKRKLTTVYNFCKQFQTIPGKPFLGELISRPKARLYNGLNFTGDYEDFNFEGSLRPKCMTLTSKLAGKLKSIETFGTCIRLYTSRYTCEGKSMAFYPRISSLPNQQMEEKEWEILQLASNIGSCYDNELDDSTIEFHGDSDENGNIEKKFQKCTTLYKNIQIVPDFIPRIGRPTDYKSTNGYPVTQYKTSQNGRIDFINAHVTLHDIRRGQRDTNIVSEEAKTAFQNGYIYAEKKEGDLMGFYIGGRLGPQKELAFHNVYPQTAHNQKLMIEQEQKIVGLPWGEISHVTIQISVNYDADNGTRPIGLLYWTTHGRDQWTSVYLSNLHSAN